ncbi:DUF1819 family protein [Bacillus pumilus]|uniref:DUF1819 family protein n=1 Tax=Bacillus pumilus TaxID=1408 RepID=UPI0011A7CB85|nr:DUF1819 family protein [Bacillus pumilus]
MTIELEYSSSLNGASYLLFELKQVVKLQQMGLSTQEIRSKVVDENIFQFENKGRITRTLPSVMRRAKVIDSTLASLMMEGSVEMSKVINLYAIMKTDLLFYEFMDEVISEKFQNNDYLIEKKDINLFFTTKSEQSDKVASWSDINIEKLKRAFMQVLFESGMLKGRRGKELNRLIIDDQIKNHLTHIGDARYVRAMGE